jgi:hypothetical protein
MRIDPAQKIEKEIADLKKQFTDLKQQCERYFNLVEEIRSQRYGWKQGKTGVRYGDRF